MEYTYVLTIVFLLTLCTYLVMVVMYEYIMVKECLAATTVSAHMVTCIVVYCLWWLELPALYTEFLFIHFY